MEEVGRDGERIGLVALKKLDCRDGPGDGGILDSVSIVLSDSDGFSSMVRPRTSTSSNSDPLVYTVEASSSSSSTSCLDMSLTPV